MTREHMPKNARRWLPHDVWMVVIWRVKGYNRMKENLQDALDAQPDQSQPHSSGGMPGSSTEAKAMKRERDRDIVAALDKALESIPEEYRKGVWNKLAYNDPYPQDAAVRTYNRYKTEFIIRAARYMKLD